MTKVVLRWLAGLGLGLLIWLGLGAGYHPILAFFTTNAFNIVEHPNVTTLQPEGESVIVRRSDFDPRSPFPKLSVSDLTFNVVLLTALAIGAGTSRNARATRIVAGFALLFVVHVAALYSKVMSIYVLQLGEWSTVNYGPIARNFWSTLTHFYRFVGCYVAAFVIWWYVLAAGRFPGREEE